MHVVAQPCLHRRPVVAQSWTPPCLSCLPPTELEICKRADGSLWQLGAGGFGRVYKAMRFGYTPVAVVGSLYKVAEFRDGVRLVHKLLVGKLLLAPNVMYTPV